MDAADPLSTSSDKPAWRPGGSTDRGFRFPRDTDLPADSLKGSAAPGVGREARRIRRGVIGVLYSPDEDHVLMVQRAPSIPSGGRWCFPGGHVEPGETARRAIVREFAEELALHVEARRRLGAIRLIEAGYVLAVWQVARRKGRLRIAEDEVSAVRWVRLPEIAAVTPGLPSNALVVALVQNRSSGA